MALGREEMVALEQEAMTTKEKKALHKRNFAEMQGKLELLDDDFDAVQNVVKRAKHAQKVKSDEIEDEKK